MQRNMQRYFDRAKEWYVDNVQASNIQHDSEKVEFMHAGDYGHEDYDNYGEQPNTFANYQTYDENGEQMPNGFSNQNGSYGTYGHVGEYEEFSEGVASKHHISEWQAGWNVTNAIQLCTQLDLSK
ncbi:hypothetical protein RvY_05737 [Ramazzottius varieornatus]|uniref:Uncharacterized protein n=1 Tax=Ramazzottius varieornatus TaxID=947166 RepID=A0A1D1UW29_RAMVA|nr:hypothetical protein RvY_05737 [Ramazzottius varieornatus]